jgi:hypothetical protein
MQAVITFGVHSLYAVTLKLAQISFLSKIMMKFYENLIGEVKLIDNKKKMYQKTKLPA